MDFQLLVQDNLILEHHLERLLIINQDQRVIQQPQLTELPLLVYLKMALLQELQWAETIGPMQLTKPVIKILM